MDQHIIVRNLNKNDEEGERKTTKCPSSLIRHTFDSVYLRFIYFIHENTYSIFTHTHNIKAYIYNLNLEFVSTNRIPYFFRSAVFIYFRFTFSFLFGSSWSVCLCAIRLLFSVGNFTIRRKIKRPFILFPSAL